MYYFNFSGSLRAQQTAFENTPIEDELMSDDRVEWVGKECEKSEFL